MKKKNRAIAYVVLAALILYISYMTGISHKTLSRGTGGLFDLSEVDLGKVSVSLAGEFLFCPNELIEPGVEADGILIDGNLFWNREAELAGEEWTEGTYRASILLRPSETPIGVWIPEIHTESRVWINGELVKETGFDGKEVYMSSALVDLGRDLQRIDMVIQVRNKRHVKSGMVSAFRVGDYERMKVDAMRANALDLVLFGVCFIAGIYHLVLSGYRKKGRELVCFSMLAFSAGVRGIFANTVLLSQLFGNLSYLAGSRILTLSTALSVVFAILYIEEIFRKSIDRGIFRWLKFPLLVYPLLVVMLDSLLYSMLFDLFLLFAVLASVCLLGVIIRAHRSGDAGAGIILFGMSVLFSTMINDILVYKQIKSGTYLATMGIAAYIVVQSLLIAWDFENQYRESLRLTEEMKYMVEELESTRLAYLHAQMRPHFLYNTLNIIAELCLHEGKRAEGLVLSLASYLRGIVESGNDEKEVALSKELELIGFYVRIEKERFPGLRFEVDVPEELMSVKVPHISLEPLVENAIKHGVRGVDSGRVLLKAEDMGGFVAFTITDNGVGMSEEQLEKIRKMEISTGQIGLGNIDKRLRTHYGSCLSIESRLGFGTTAGYCLQKGDSYDRCSDCG